MFHLAVRLLAIANIFISIVSSWRIWPAFYDAQSDFMFCLKGIAFMWILVWAGLLPVLVSERARSTNPNAERAQFVLDRVFAIAPAIIFLGFMAYHCAVDKPQF